MKKTLISVVINTLNEAAGLERCLNSVKGLADEVIVVDMESEDESVKVAESFGAKIFPYKKMSYVELARNFAISKASGKWILILDPDEKVPRSLAKRLRLIAEEKKDVDYVLIPRKNIIFGQWIKNTLWWPDYLVRFFRKGTFRWPKEIHRQPELKGNGLTLPDEERFALLHYHYNNLDQYLSRGRRYAAAQAKELMKNKSYVLRSKDLLLKPTEEFLSRYFLGEGHKDGLHGLVLAKLQEYSVFLIYAKVWEKAKFAQKNLEKDRIREMMAENLYQLEYWRNRWLKENYKGDFRFWPLFLINKLRELLLKIK